MTPRPAPVRPVARLPRLPRAAALVALLVSCLLIVPGPAPAADAEPASTPRAAGVVHLGGVTVRLRPGTRQVVTVRHTRGYHARITFWRLADGGWVRVRRVTDGRTGYGGLVPGARRRQGSGTTPLGSYRLLSTFGTHRAEEGERLRHRRIRRGDFWVQDNASPYYNRYRNQRQGGFRWRLPSSDPNSSERLTDYRRQYEYALVLDFNRDQVRHRGAGIFLHVNGRGATAGCVSAPRPFLRMLVRRLDPASRPVIAVGR